LFTFIKTTLKYEKSVILKHKQTNRSISILRGRCPGAV